VDRNHRQENNHAVIHNRFGSPPDWCIFFRVKKLWSIFSTLALMAILAAGVVPRIPANAQNAPKNLKVLTPETYMAAMQTFPPSDNDALELPQVHVPVSLLVALPGACSG